ncbi:hypothetical protein PC9H_000462 [Pleurotus ostreatus]|uniref:Major facilitator superfamily (MFS) profile domain-containing protein n=1 Tax=Pleurotus ostreatus TaxID=5322 RepID=A0A8H7A1Z9_PLEOS|nr:uncharacterized protein PC9H_000462 [Pleurotus ostreatus]KAF7440118.1 hypothetical protein PC9H_000462 [Pleurotus ostreatus]
MAASLPDYREGEGDTPTLHSMDDKEKQEISVKETVLPSSHQEFPEGGLQAWLSVLGAILVQFCTFGYISSFGVYQGYVATYLTAYSSSEIGWIGSIQVMLIMSMGLFTGRAFDAGYFHHLVLGGTILHGFAFFMLSLSHQDQYYQVFLTHGLLGGVGCGVMYIPSLGIPSHYFHRKRALTMGIVSAGASAGAVIHPIMLNRLFHGSFGFHNGVRASAGMNLGLLLLANVLMKPRLPPKKAASIHVKAFIRDIPYVFVVFSGFLCMTAMFIPIFFLQLKVVKGGMNRTFAFYSISIMNGASVVGRLIPGFFVQRFGVINLMVVNTFGIIALMFCFMVVKTVAGVVCFAIFFGLFSGSVVTLMPPLLASLARDFNEIGARMGLCFTLMGFGGLVGSPIAGALLTSDYIWWRPVVFGGVVMTIGQLLMIIARFLVVHRKGTQKV